MVHRFRGPAPRGLEESGRHAEVFPAPESQYWSPVLDAYLMRGRLARRLDMPITLRADSEKLKAVQRQHKVDSLVVEAVDAGAWPVAPIDGQWVWLAWLTLRLSVAEADKPQATFAQVQTFLADYHLWAPNYVGAQLPVLGSDATAHGTVLDVLADCLPASAQYLGPSLGDGVFDQRFGVWALVDTGVFPPDERTLRALVDVDPPSGMEAVTAWQDRWLSERIYRRWPEVIYGFTHHSGVVAHAGLPWLETLCRPRYPISEPRGAGCYFDMALLVFGECALEAEVRRLRAARGLGLADEVPTDVADGTLRALGEVVWSPIDQGRALAALWRRVARSDLGFPKERGW